MQIVLNSKFFADLSVEQLGAKARELGSDGVLLNTGVAGAKNPVLMAEAMRLAVESGRKAFLAGRIPRKLYATASSPLEGVIGAG